MKRIRAWLLMTWPEPIVCQRCGIVNRHYAATHCLGCGQPLGQ